MSVVYVDTSLLANRYLPSPLSMLVDALLDDVSSTFVISELSLIEFESALARRQREGRLSERRVNELRGRFEGDLTLDFFTVEPISSAALVTARSLISDMRAPLAALDSIHLGTAIAIGADAFATDDRHLARAAATYGLPLVPLDRILS